MAARGQRPDRNQRTIHHFAILVPATPGRASPVHAPNVALPPLQPPRRLSGVIPVVVISLRRSTDRREHIAAHLGRLGIPYRWFDAIDGATLSPAQRARYGPTMPPGAMGCAESHLTVLHAIAEGSDPFVCILEDDAELSPAVVDLLDAAALGQLPSFDVLRLEGADGRSRPAFPVARFAAFELHLAFRNMMATTAQIFSRAGARKIVAGITTLPVAIDVALFLECYVLGLRVIEARPSLARPRPALPSVIGPGQPPPYTWWQTFRMRRLRSREWRRAVSFLMAWGPSGLLRARRAKQHCLQPPSVDFPPHTPNTRRQS
jgi:GR25 family glycosyltransferase involved in LPS biosynthesis